MPTKAEKPEKTSDVINPDATRRPSFITSEMIEKNPVLASAGAFAGDPYWKELIQEIKKERGRQRRREREQDK